MISIATWNVNSIKARHDRAMRWVEKFGADVICLQELKVTEENFPAAEFQELGYASAVNGQKTWNGVAILSRHPIENVMLNMGDGVDDPQSRVVACRTADINVICVYVPNGKTVGSDKWEYKLDWLRRFRKYLDKNFDPADDLVVCGDINVAPDDTDVAFPERWSESVLCHEDGRAALQDILDWGLEDTMRLHHEGPGPYSWWDYRMLAFPKGNGVRIDHVFATESMAERSDDAFVERDERKGEKPSDHAPVIAVFQ